MVSNEDPANAGSNPAEEMPASANPEKGASGSTDLNDLMELEILREVDAAGNPVPAAEEEIQLDTDSAAEVSGLRRAGDDGAEDRVEALEQERDRLREDLLRVQADFINFRKRLEREKSDVVRRASQSLIEELLPVLDNFELALSNNRQADPETFSEGVRMIHKQLLDLLTRHGLREVSCVGETFDPNIHEAVAVISDPEKESNTVVAELKKGYYLRDRLIRSPMVQVVINKESGRDNGEGPEGPATLEP